ncbi:hypothetical protein TSAR_009518 [Trichomalopsis sarcophagae]|uniref:Uncharacterized protein n=1 Tax=Trichomalopsis sarcophagae TaxID=543379 RepID=A0A232EJE2_9HYME|nr:hypothetical protein TSAR_009518 [Trichomalopsis sarcophagae]
MFKTLPSLKYPLTGGDNEYALVTMQPILIASAHQTVYSREITRGGRRRHAENPNRKSLGQISRWATSGRASAAMALAQSRGIKMAVKPCTRLLKLFLRVDKISFLSKLTRKHSRTYCSVDRKEKCHRVQEAEEQMKYQQ